MLRLLLFCEVGDGEPAFFRVVDGVLCSATILRQVADTVGAPIDKRPISLLHAAPHILLTDVLHCVSLPLDMLVPPHIVWPPPGSLIATGEEQKE